MFPSAEKQLNPAKGDHPFPYAFSALPQEASVVPIQEEHDSSQGEENRKISQPNTSFNESANGLFEEIIYYVGLLTCIGILLYKGYRYTIEIHFVHPSPLLETNSLTISNLTISSSKFEGIWDVYLTFGHSLDDYAEVTYYNLFTGSIYYKQVSNVHTRNFLANVNPTKFYVRQKEVTRVHLEFTNTGWEAEQPGQEQVIKKINEEVESGVLHFSMDIVFKAEFQKWGEIWSGPNPYRTSRYCWDLMAGIDRARGEGRLIKAIAVYCR